MFFNRHIKQGEELGESGLTMIKQCFDGSQYLNGEIFSPPSNFFDDLYIRGFLTSWIGYLIEFAFGGSSWSSQKKGECSIAAMMIIDPSSALKNHHLSLADPAILRSVADSKDFQNGQNGAISLVGTVYKRLPEDDPDPVLKEAKSLAETLSKNQQALGMSMGEGSALGAALVMVTIRRHIRDNWLLDDC